MLGETFDHSGALCNFKRFFFKYSNEKRTGCVLSQLRRHNFLRQEFIYMYFTKSAKSTIVKTICFLKLTKLMRPPDIVIILNF